MEKSTDFFVQLLPRLRLRASLPPPRFPRRERGKAPPPRGALRLPTDAANVRLAQVAMETDEKRRPGLFETIIRRSIPCSRQFHAISFACTPDETKISSPSLNKKFILRLEIIQTVVKGSMNFSELLGRLEDVGRCWKMFEAMNKSWDWIPSSSEIQICSQSLRRIRGYVFGDVVTCLKSR